MGVHRIPTTVCGPRPEGTVGLLLGRSSSALKGLQITPRVIDPDFTGEIKILASSPWGIVSISPGDRIVQLLILPSQHSHFPASNKERGNQGLGSIGTPCAFLMLNLRESPMTALHINGKASTGLLDTGADKSIIKREDWPKAWPIQKADQALRGLGIASNPDRSATLLNWRDDEGHQGLV